MLLLHKILLGYVHLTCNIYFTLGNTVGNDPHFFLQLRNGDNMCFSVQGEPDFMFSLIKDKYVQLNGQFVLPAEDESHTIANVSTFLGNLGLLLRCPITSNTKAILISAEDRSIKVGDIVTAVRNKVVTVDIRNELNVSVIIDAEEKNTLHKEESPTLYVNTDLGFAMNVKFYKKHINIFITKTTGLTENVHGLIG